MCSEAGEENDAQARRFEAFPVDPKLRDESIRVVRSMLSPALKQFDRRGHSNTPASVHHPSARAAHRGRPHPNGNPSSHSSPVLTGPISALRPERSPLPQGGADPKTAGSDGQESVPRYSAGRFPVRRKNRLPNNEYAHPLVRVMRKKLLRCGRPPQTARSSRRQQQHHPGRIRVGIEGSRKLVQICIRECNETLLACWHG